MCPRSRQSMNRYLAGAGLHAGHHVGQSDWRLPDQFARVPKKIVPSWRTDERARLSSCHWPVVAVAILWSQADTRESARKIGKLSNRSASNCTVLGPCEVR